MDKNNIQQKTIHRSVSFLTLGCKVNAYETTAMEKLFAKAGYEIKEFTERSLVYVINTCTVTNMADRKSRQMIHKAKKMNPDAVIVAVGCYVQAAKEQLESDETINIIIGNNQKNQIVNIVEDYLAGKSKSEFCTDKDITEEYEELQIDTAGEKTRAYIKIQDGCNQFCSYCIIPLVRGRIRSRNPKEVIAEVKRLTDHGYKEVVLTGIHLSSYGVDFLGMNDFVQAKGKPLLELIQEINEMEGVYRIRLGSLEPRIISDEFVRELSKNTKICPHFHLSLQSGCNETLKRMNRKYSTGEYYDKCNIIRKYFDKPAITTDVIVGFPGETKEEFEETKMFLEKVNFSDMHIFKYSKRKGTKAERMENQVSDSIKNQRSNELLGLAKNMNQKYKELFLGTKQKVLIEETINIDNNLYHVGHNERYLKLAVLSDRSDGSRCNSISDVTIEGELNQDILLAIFNGLY